METTIFAILFVRVVFMEIRRCNSSDENMTMSELFSSISKSDLQDLYGSEGVIFLRLIFDFGGHVDKKVNIKDAPRSMHLCVVDPNRKPDTWERVEEEETEAKECFADFEEMRKVALEDIKSVRALYEEDKILGMKWREFSMKQSQSARSNLFPNVIQCVLIEELKKLIIHVAKLCKDSGKMGLVNCSGKHNANNIFHCKLGFSYRAEDLVPQNLGKVISKAVPCSLELMIVRNVSAAFSNTSAKVAFTSMSVNEQNLICFAMPPKRIPHFTNYLRIFMQRRHVF